MTREADLIVVGTMHPNASLPWFDGWHMSGTVEVHEVVFGATTNSHIEYRFVCKFLSMCRHWPPPRFTGSFLSKGLWFFKRSGEDWQPVGFGFDALSSRIEVEDYIRKYKLPSAK
jgi:hypothetical protein